MRTLIIVAAALFLTACKIQITVPEGGKVVWRDGECAEGQVCVIEVTDDTFDETFTAMPNDDFIFAGWKTAQGHFCGGTVISCRLFTTGFGENEKLNAILESDQAFFLEPVFERAEYDIAYWRLLIEELDEQRFENSFDAYSVTPDPSTCTPGTMYGAYTGRALAVLNKTRELYGMEPSVYQVLDDPLTMASALVNAANDMIVSLPQMGVHACWSNAAENTSPTASFNEWPVVIDPARDMLSWLNDNAFMTDGIIDETRRYLLQPPPRFISYGQAVGWSVLKKLSSQNPPLQAPPWEGRYVAYPFGVAPFLLMEQAEFPTRWSFTWVPDTNSLINPNEYYNNAIITVTDQATGEEMPINNIYSDTLNIGINNFLSWEVEGWRYDTTYVVSIRNIELPAGEIRDVSYRVFIDRRNLVDINFPLEEFDEQDGQFRMEGLFDTEVDRDTFTVTIPGGETTFSGFSNFSNQAFTIFLFDEFKRPVIQSDKEFTVDLEPGQYSVVVSPCDAVRCVFNVTKYEVVITP